MATRTALCPFCRAVVICEDATCTIRHASPVCVEFAAQLARFGLVAKRERWLALVRVSSGEKQ